MTRKTTIQLEKDKINVLITSLQFVLQHQEKIDWSMMCFPSLKSIQNVLNKLLMQQDISRKTICMEMTETELMDLTGSIHCAMYAVEDNNDIAVLEDLYDYYSELQM